MRRPDEQWEQGADKCRVNWHVNRPAENIEAELEDEKTKRSPK